MSNWDKDREDRLREVENGLSAHRATTDEQMKTVFKNMGTLTFEIGQLVKETSRLNLNIETDRIHHAGLKSQLCSKPDTCIKLEPLVLAHEKVFNEQRGGWKAIVTIAGFASVIAAPVGAVVGWIISHKDKL